MTSKARRRAKDKGFPFDLTSQYIMSIAEDVCPVFGTELCWERGNGFSPNSPTLDRIVPELGYVEGNVAVISMRANAIKQDATPDELRKVADWIEKETSK